MVILDLGCGKRKTPGAFGTDIAPLPGVDLLCVLTRVPYPFATDSVDGVHLNHVLEHKDNPVAVLTEVWRVSKDRAKVQIRVPHYTGRYAWRDPTHKRCFSSESFGYFGENGYSYYTDARFHVVSVRLAYEMVAPERKVYRIWGRLVQAMLDRHPTFSERFLAYLVGGIDELQVTLEAVKIGALKGSE